MKFIPWTIIGIFFFASIANAQTLIFPSRISTTTGSSGNVLMISNGSWVPYATSSGAGTINTGTANRLTYYSGGTTLDSANSFIVNAANGSTTFPTLNVGTLTATTGTSYINALSLGTALSDGNIASAATWNAKQSAISVTWPITLSAANIGFNGLSTTSQPTMGNIPYFSTVNGFAVTATGTITCNSGLSCGSGSYVVGSNLTITGSGAYPFTPTTFNGLTTSGTSTAISSTLGFYASSTSILASTTVLGSFNTGTLTATSGTSWINALSLGTALSVGNGGTGSTTFTPGNLLYGNLGGALQSVATSSETCSSPLSCTSFAVVGAGGAITLGTVTVAKGGTNNTVFPANSIIVSASDGLSLVATGTTLYSGSFYATSSTATSTLLGGLSVSNSEIISGNSNIAGGLTVHASSSIAGPFYVTSSTTINSDNITLGGSATATKDFTVLGKFAQFGSSTVSMTGTTLIDFNVLGNNQRWIATGNTNIVLNSTSSNPGALAGAIYGFKIGICQDSTGGRTITFSSPQSLRWAGGNAATTTFITTANTMQWFGGIYDPITAHYFIVASSTSISCF